MSHLLLSSYCRAQSKAIQNLKQVHTMPVIRLVYMMIFIMPHKSVIPFGWLVIISTEWAHQLNRNLQVDDSVSELVESSAQENEMSAGQNVELWSAYNSLTYEMKTNWQFIQTSHHQCSCHWVVDTHNCAGPAEEIKCSIVWIKTSCSSCDSGYGSA